MRIGLFTDTYPPFINGVSTSVEMLKNALEKKGHTVYIVTVNESTVKYNYDEENHVLRVPSIPIGWYNYRMSGTYPIRGINIIKKWKLDVIHSHTELGIGIIGRIVSKQFNIPLVHTYHTMYEDYTHYVAGGHLKHTSKAALKYLTEFYCDKTATELIVPTAKTYKLFKDKYKFERNIHIIPSGIEVDRFFKENVDSKEIQLLKKNLKITKNDFIMLFVGRLASEKNVEFLLDLEEKLLKKNKAFKLLIVGDGPDKEKYEEIAKKKKIDANTIFTGKVAWDDMPLYYHLANIFITASITETQGLTVIEAMASGLAPFCIDDPAFLSMCTDELNSVIFKDLDDCYKKVIEFHGNKEKQKRLNSQARIQSEHLSSARYADSVLEVYEHAIKEKNKNRYGIISAISRKIKKDK